MIVVVSRPIVQGMFSSRHDVPDYSLWFALQLKTSSVKELHRLDGSAVGI